MKKKVHLKHSNVMRDLPAEAAVWFSSFWILNLFRISNFGFGIEKLEARNPKQIQNPKRQTKRRPANPSAQSILPRPTLKFPLRILRVGRGPG
jgi:hypothetical protein